MTNTDKRRWTDADVPDRFKSVKADTLRELLSLTEAEIREMPAGPRLDALVWRHAIGPIAELPTGPFSTDATLALHALNRVNGELDVCGQLMWGNIGWLVGGFDWGDPEREVIVSGYDAASMALAIARFLLLDAYLTDSDPSTDPSEFLEDDE